MKPSLFFLLTCSLFNHLQCMQSKSEPPYKKFKKVTRRFSNFSSLDPARFLPLLEQLVTSDNNIEQVKEILKIDYDFNNTFSQSYRLLHSAKIVMPF